MERIFYFDLPTEFSVDTKFEEVELDIKEEPESPSNHQLSSFQEVSCIYTSEANSEEDPLEINPCNADIVTDVEDLVINSEPLVENCNIDDNLPLSHHIIPYIQPFCSSLDIPYVGIKLENEDNNFESNLSSDLDNQSSDSEILQPVPVSTCLPLVKKDNTGRWKKKCRKKRAAKKVGPLKVVLDRFYNEAFQLKECSVLLKDVKEFGLKQLSNDCLLTNKKQPCSFPMKPRTLRKRSLITHTELVAPLNRSLSSQNGPLVPTKQEPTSATPRTVTPGIFKCQFCHGNKFGNRDILNEHLVRKHMKMKHFDSLDCDICQEQLTSIESLVDHLLTVHMAASTVREDRCPLCRKSHEIFEKVRMKNITFLCRKYLCCQCGKTFRNATLLKHHIQAMRYKIYGTSHRCHLCHSNKFKSRESLNEHLVRKHMKVKDTDSLDCDICQNQSTSIESLREHLVTFHITESPNKGKGACLLCPEPLHNVYEKVQVKNVPLLCRMYRCCQCDEVFDSTAVLKQHCQTTHYRYKCSICKWRSKYSNGIKYHKLTVHNTSLRECEICKGQFKNILRLMYHVRASHKGKSFCLHCSTIIDSASVSEHVAAHLAKRRRAAVVKQRSSTVRGDGSKQEHLAAHLAKKKAAAVKQCNLRIRGDGNKQEHIAAHLAKKKAAAVKQCNLRIRGDGNKQERIASLLAKKEKVAAVKQRNLTLRGDSSKQEHIASHLLKKKVSSVSKHKSANTVNATSSLEKKATDGFACSTCRRSFPSMQDLVRHKLLESHYEYNCDLCSQPIASKEMMVDHMIKMHFI